MAVTGKRVFNLAYGTRELAVELPADQSSVVLEPRPFPTLAEPEAAVAQALREPIDSPPLVDLVRHAEVVFVSDLPDGLARQLWMTPAKDAQQALDLARERCGAANPAIVVLPHGSITYPVAG